jgi:hypothetical protein
MISTFGFPQYGYRDGNRIGISAGSKTVRAVIFYEYGFINILNKLNKDVTLQALNNGDNFKGNLGCINAQVVFNL